MVCQKERHVEPNLEAKLESIQREILICEGGGTNTFAMVGAG